MGSRKDFSVSMLIKPSGAWAKRCIAVIRIISPHRTVKRSKNFLTGWCFFSRSDKAYTKEKNTVIGMRMISTHKLKVQKPTKNSMMTDNAIFSFIKLPKKRLSFAFSIVFTKIGNSTRRTQNTVSLSKLMFQKPIHFRKARTRNKNPANTK